MKKYPEFIAEKIQKKNKKRKEAWQRKGKVRRCKLCLIENPNIKK